MATMTIRLPDDLHERLKMLAERRGQSVNKLFEEFSIRAIAEADSYTSFQSRATSGDAETGLALLDKLDAHYGTSRVAEDSPPYKPGKR